MDLALIGIGLLFLLGMRPAFGEWRDNYLDHEVTKSINGLFILLVIFSHFMTYVPNTLARTSLTNIWMLCKGELIVTTFLFFSGFGIMEQIKKRGATYVESFPVKRIGFVWFKFIVAVTCFWLLSLSLEKTFEPTRVLLAYVGLTTIGNSGWYIFAILLMYTLTYVAFKLAGSTPRQAIGIVLLGSLVYIVIASGRLADYYYETILCYVAGMAYSEWRKPIEGLIRKRPGNYWWSLIADIVVFLMSYYGCYRSIGWIHYLSYQIAAIAFVLIFVLLAMKVRFQNPWLAYVGGSALFSIYILQRIPMLIGKLTVLVRWPLVYFVVVLISTILLGWGFDQIVDHVLRRRLKKSLVE